MKTTLFSKIILVALSIPLVLSSFVACKKDNYEDNGTDAEEGKNLFDISGYTIVRAGIANKRVATQTENLKSAIKDRIGLDLAVAVDDDAPETEKEILIGKTNRAASQAALDKLAEKTDKEAYVIDITDNKIAIVGTTDNATQRAVKLFIMNYVNESSEGSSINIKAGKTVVQRYYSENVDFFENGVEVETSDPVTIFEATGRTTSLGVLMDATSSHYPSIIELQYQPNKEDNGKLIAHFCLRDNMTDSDACFVESSDGGKTWSLLSRPEEQSKPGIAVGLAPGQMAHIYELPAQLGEYPAGTLVYASGSINYSVRSEIWMWYSTDCGKTWTQTAKIAIGGGSTVAVPGWPKQSGVWEPFVWYEDGYLYCFYSDDSDPEHDQKLVYKRSKDGVKWSKIVDVCKFSNSTDRPGMFVMTKMGNGEFFMVYEYIGSPEGYRVYYKKTNDITSWNPSDPGEVLKSGNYSGGGAPACLWIPAGGECGTLIATACKEINGDGNHRIFVSFDYGETWTTMANPLPYTYGADAIDTRVGYSPSFALGADGMTVYYLNTTDIPETGKRRMQFVCFKIY